MQYGTEFLITLSKQYSAAIYTFILFKYIISYVGENK